MKFSRRDFFKITGVATLSSVLHRKSFAWHSKAPDDAYGVLVDLTRCIGCRKCEEACNKEHKLPEPEKKFDDLTVFNEKRRPNAKAYTVVNRFYDGELDEFDKLKPFYAKVQCMHCLDPACVSACLAGALTKKETGAVHYDVTKCIGCRYCIVSCPFEIPAYEYYDPITPKVMKCTFCFDKIGKEGGIPACANICPVEALTFGKRKALLSLAKNRIQDEPGKYIKKIYGEKEVGGTSWLYISSKPFEKTDLPTLPHKPIPRLVETIQHSLFSYLWSPILLFGTLKGIMFISDRKNKNKEENK